MVEIVTLVERCRRGDALAWEALVRTHQSRVFAVAVHYLRDRDAARDLAQDVFIRVYRRLDTFDGGERFLPWLLSLTRNACIDHLRRRKARRRDDAVTIDDAPQLAADEPSPEDTSHGESAKRLLHRALSAMSEKNREMILLKEIQGLKLEEIAQMLALPIGTVKSRSNRARVELASRVRGLDPSYGS